MWRDQKNKKLKRHYYLTYRQKRCEYELQKISPKRGESANIFYNYMKPSHLLYVRGRSQLYATPDLKSRFERFQLLLLTFHQLH